ncbi:MAG: hypothetical protein NPMRIOTA_170011 [Nitrosopumilales archaeon]|nr:MAG: hypothetical protein NPMRIOTA_170011 [Nitrosopumilales archaeon]
MGGAKRRSPAQQEKAQISEAEKKAGTKTKKGGMKASKKTEIRVILNEQEANNFIKNSKCFTVHEFARDSDVKISTANAFLVKSLQSGSVKRVGGYSGHYIYQAA